MNLSHLFDKDKLLMKFESHIRNRISNLYLLVKLIEKKYGSLDKFSNAHSEFGIHQIGCNVIAREWIPNVARVYLLGDFNNWDETRHEFTKADGEIFELLIENLNLFQINISKIKLKIVTNSNEIIYRASPWTRYLIFNDGKNLLEPVVYFDKEKYIFKHNRPNRVDNLKIYEAHIGISSSKPEIATYSYFRTDVLPRIKCLGYTAVQLMGIMEHAYYGSFGYQITNFFACSSRFGTPNELKELIDTAHELELRVFLDIVHSHASSNVEDGLNGFNGSDECFFHNGMRGYHPVWKTRLFNYSKLEVLRFLISNLRWWIEEYNFDGFRFDGVSSMLYYDHGLRVQFSGEYFKYFDLNVDTDSVTYLMLANYFLKNHFPFATTICEDVSGMPTLCVPLESGGFGFDYRLGMGIPDMWVKIVQSNHSKYWDMNFIVSVLCNRRVDEKTIAYVESHDQALVGDKTLAFWLMDKYMYTHMSIFSPSNTVVDRGLAFHMMIRMITHGLGGESYLNFMGNEFGHPEWLDFPREGNKWSYTYARRQWNLVDDVDLKYKSLAKFDKRLNELEGKYKWLSSQKATILQVCNTNKIICFVRAEIIFLFNFNEENSFESYKVGITIPGKYQCILDTDSSDFGGFNRIDESVCHFSQLGIWQNQDQYLSVYLPSRTGQMCVLSD